MFLLRSWHANECATQTGNPGYAASYNDRLKEIRLNSATGTIEKTYSYDNEGRLSVQGGANAATLIWDAKGRLATLIRSASAETYGYDPLDRRISRSGGTLGNLDYYLEGEHLESVSSGGQVQEKYFRGSSIDELKLWPIQSCLNIYPPCWFFH